MIPRPTRFYQHSRSPFRQVVFFPGRFLTLRQLLLCVSVLCTTETTQTIKLIQAETLKLEELNVVENKLNDDLMASLDPDNVPPTMPTNAQMGTGRLLQCQPQQEQSQHSVEGWHLVHKIGTPKKCYCHDCEEDRRDDDTGDSEAEDGQPRKRMSK